MFLDHLLAVSEVFVRLVEAHRAEQLDLLWFQAEPACWRWFASLHGRTVMKPDALVVVGHGEWEHRWFIEVDRGTETCRPFAARPAAPTADRPAKQCAPPQPHKVSRGSGWLRTKPGRRRDRRGARSAGC